jgi:hypothetical protein
MHFSDNVAKEVSKGVTYGITAIFPCNIYRMGWEETTYSLAALE